MPERPDTSLPQALSAAKRVRLPGRGRRGYTCRSALAAELLVREPRQDSSLSRHSGCSLCKTFQRRLGFLGLARAPGAPRAKDSRTAWASGEPIRSRAMMARMVRRVSGDGSSGMLFRICCKRRRVSSERLPSSAFCIGIRTGSPILSSSVMAAWRTRNVSLPRSAIHFPILTGSGCEIALRRLRSKGMDSFGELTMPTLLGRPLRHPHQLFHSKHRQPAAWTLFRSRLELPGVALTILAMRKDRVSIRAKGKGGNFRLVPRQAHDFFTGDSFPDVKLAVRAGGS